MNKKTITTLQGGIAKDARGQIRFVNEFDMGLVKRFYLIKNADTDLVRGWRAHRIEQRWFYVLSGGFSVSVVEIDDWETPDPHLPLQHITIKSDDMRLLHIPSGYGTAFRALESNSEMLVFADYSIEHASYDDYTWNQEYFLNIGAH